MRNVLVIFGMQGSGKGTQGERIKERYGGFTDIIVGQLLREKMKTNKEMQELMKTGNLFPDEMVEGVIEEKIQTLPEGEKILFDGFPRSESQFEMFQRLSNKYQFDIVAINILINEKEAFKRLSKRYICPKCDYFQVGKGKCPKCGTKLELRSDDVDVNVIKKRIEIFKKNTQPIINHFKEKGQLIEIDGIGTFDEVSERIFKKLDDYYK
jgi:adenylate kinase